MVQGLLSLSKSLSRSLSKPLNYPGRYIHQLSKALGIDQSIYKKISSGYALALGTAVIGISGGLLGGHYYAQPVHLQTEQMQQQKQLLNLFNNYLLNLQNHPSRLLAIGSSKIWVQYEINEFNVELKQTHDLLDKLEQSAAEASQLNTEIDDLVQDYRVTLQTYEDFVNGLWDGLQNIDDKQVAIETLATAIGSTNATELSTDLELLSEDLTRLQQTVDQNYDQATAQLEQVESLQLIIIFSSMAASIALAVVLAFMTSRAIARPIEQLTTVARRVTEDNDFRLQAPIQTRDEVSLLAQAINQLVSWAGQYTRELETAHQTLEQRADDLQHALNELKQTQLQLIQSEKMSSLGQMVAGVAHEINNPVSFIHGNLQHALSYTEEIMKLLDLYQSCYPSPDPKIQAIIEDIDLPFLQTDFPKIIRSMGEGTTRICDIVKSLRTFSRLDEAAIKHVDLHTGIESTLIILNNRLKPTANSPAIQVIRNYGSLPMIECYAGQLNQVFMNILSNAIDALETTPHLSNPTITITTAVVEHNWIEVHIADNGSGIPEQARHRLFDPFFTTKPVGKGTGLGLSISYQIVTEAHKGYLTCESTPGKGTCFMIKLPIK